MALLVLPATRIIAAPAVTVVGTAPGVSPFISRVSLQIDNPASLEYVKFEVQPRPGSVTRPITARYSRDYLQRRGFLAVGSKDFIVPVFGLYAGRENTVFLTVGFADGGTQRDILTIATEKYKAPLHKRYETLQARTPDTSLSYDFILLKSYNTPDCPLVIDTDGQIRWVGTAGVGGEGSPVPAQASIFYGNRIFVGQGTSLFEIQLDGEVNIMADYVNSLQGVSFHHNADFGKQGILLELNTVNQVESLVMEVDTAGNILRTWDMAAIINAAMREGGDDPSAFVRPPPDDWFHSNAAAYNPEDDSIAISSRENFIISLDYSTGAIKWIFGDPTKKWYEYPSLRRFALTKTKDSHYPIGQHGLSYFQGELTYFDNGAASLNQEPTGKNRAFSTARKFRIDPVAKTATETWQYTNGKSIYSPYCSSIYEDQPDNYLLNYSTADNLNATLVQGLNSAGEVVFAYRYPRIGDCDLGWNATVLHWEELVFN